MAAITLSPGIYTERGGLYGSKTGLRWVVFNSTLSSVVAGGDSLATSGAGVAVISLASSPYNVGDWVPVFITEYNAATPAVDRIVKTFFGFVQAT